MRPCLAYLEKENGWLAVQVETVNTVHSHRCLVREASDTRFLENFLQENNHVVVMSANNCLLRALVQMSN